LTTFLVKDASKAFSYEFAESMSCRRIVVLRRGLLLGKAGELVAENHAATSGPLKHAQTYRFAPMCSSRTNRAMSAGPLQIPTLTSYSWPPWDHAQTSLSVSELPLAAQSAYEVSTEIASSSAITSTGI
jgi:hypothetical protein